jgi:hypothetical protein
VVVEADNFFVLFEGGDRKEFLLSKYAPIEALRRTQMWSSNSVVSNLTTQQIAAIIQNPEQPHATGPDTTLHPDVVKTLVSHYQATLGYVHNDLLKCMWADPTSKLTNAQAAAEPDGQNVVAAGGYSEWIIRCFMTASAGSDGTSSYYNRFMEDLYKIREDLDIFRRIQTRLPVEDRNIFSLKSPDDLFRLVNQFAAQNGIAKTKMQNMQDVMVLHDEPELFVGIPKTFTASRMLGTGTRWCTASSTYGQGTFDQYHDKGPLIVIIHRLKGLTPPNEIREVKYQFHYETGQFMNAQDSPVDPKDIFEKIPKLRGILWQFFGKRLQDPKGMGWSTPRAELLGGLAGVTDLNNPEEVTQLVSTIQPTDYPVLARRSTVFFKLIEAGAIPWEEAKKAWDATHGDAYLESPKVLRVYVNSLTDLQYLFSDHRDSARHYAVAIFKQSEGGDGLFNDYYPPVEHCTGMLSPELEARVERVVKAVVTSEQWEDNSSIDYWLKNPEESEENSEVLEELANYMTSAGATAIRYGAEAEGWKQVMGALKDVGLYDFKWISSEDDPSIKVNTYRPSFAMSTENLMSAAQHALDNGYEEDGDIFDMFQSWVTQDGELADFDTRYVDHAAPDEEAFNEELNGELSSIEEKLGLNKPAKKPRKKTVKSKAAESFTQLFN